MTLLDLGKKWLSPRDNELRADLVTGCDHRNIFFQKQGGGGVLCRRGEARTELQTVRGRTVTETVRCLIHMYSPFISLATPRLGGRTLPPGIGMFSSVLLGTRYEMPAIHPVSCMEPVCVFF